MESIEYGDIPRLSAIPFIVLRGFLLILFCMALIFFGVPAVCGQQFWDGLVIFPSSLYLLIVSQTADLATLSCLIQ